MDLDDFADRTVLYEFEKRICIKKREDRFVSPSLFFAACAGKLYEFVLYNSYKKLSELVQKPHRVRMRTIQFVQQLYELVQKPHRVRICTIQFVN